MKKWCIILALLLLLTGCSGQAEPVDRPPSLQVTYGETSIYAQTSAYQWYWKDGRETATATVDAAAMGISMEKMPRVNATKDTALRLDFSRTPDKILVQCYGAEDNYATAREIEVVGSSMPAPLDGGNYLMKVSAVWLEGGGENWGSCTYDFHFMATGAVISNPSQLDVAGDLGMEELLQLQPSDVLGIEFLNNYAGTTKTCRSAADKDAILRFFRENLVLDPEPMGGAVPVMEYMLRLVTVNGSQLTIGYGTDGNTGCLTLGESAYASGPLDLGALWEATEAGAVSQEAAESGKNYLAMSEEFPGENWGSTFVYGYLRQLDQSLVYDEMRWIDDTEAPNGYRLENGWPDQSANLAANCEFWILENHASPYCRVTAEELWQWVQDAGFDVLFRIYTSADGVTAICQQYVP